MVDVKQEIVSSLQKVIKELIKDLALQGDALEASELVLQTPKDENHGDYSTNVAMAIFSSSKFRTPLELAKKIVQTLNTRYKILHTDRVEAVAPGFINFWISKDYLITLMIYIIKVKDSYGTFVQLKNKKIMVEFTDPNPFKEFHIGHLYSNAVGESLSRLLEAQGANVKRANYQGDVGLHVAKALYGILKSKNQISKIENKSLGERIKFLGEAYALGAKDYEVSEKAKREIEELNKKIYDKDPTITRLYEQGRQWSLEYFEEIYKRLGTKFDYYYFESEVGIDGLKLVKEYLKKGVFEESQNAVIFPGEKYVRLPDGQGLHNRVFINSLGLPTYEAKELGLALRKYRDFSYDHSIVITGNEIIGYFKVLIAALEKIHPDLAAKTKHLSHGMVKLPTGKMSSRSGNVITGEWLLDEAKNLLKSKYSEMTEDTLEKVAVGSVKYALLKSSIGHDIEFDFEESINIQGNSGPYLQYTYARTRSVLAKLKTQNSNVKITASHNARASRDKQNSKFENEELSLLRAMCRFPEVVEEAGRKFAPNLLCNYLFDLSQKFNLFYQKHKILESEEREFRIQLTAAVGQIIKNGLKLLGIQAPERM